MRQVTALLALLAIAAGCNDYPVHRLLDSFEARVTTTLKHDQPIKLDFIWMIDDSPSMCGHQVGLAKGFGTFIDQLKQAGQIDAQMAVVSVQQIADIDTSSPIFIDRVGRFVNRPAQKFPPNCIESFKAPCASDAQCAKFGRTSNASAVIGMSVAIVARVASIRSSTWFNSRENAADRLRPCSRPVSMAVVRSE